MARHFRTEPKGFLRRPDGRWVVGYGKHTWQSVPAPVGPSFYAPDFFLSAEKPWLCFEKCEVWSQEQWLEEAQNGSSDGDSPAYRFTSPEKESFLRRTRDLLEVIASGSIDKAVPVEFERATRGDAFAGGEFLSRLALTPGTLFPYGFWTGSEGIWGATPEFLFHKSSLRLETMALAGTGRLDDPSLLENSKERHEHQLVIDDIRQALAPFGEVIAGETAEKILPRIKHLFTPITVQLSSPRPVDELVRALHPTAALGGFPRAKASAWLRSQPEARIRGRFGAPFGVVDGDSAFVVVAIRNVQLAAGALWLGSGCGVVQGSDPEKEWLELELKRDSVRNLLGLA